MSVLYAITQADNTSSLDEVQLMSSAIVHRPITMHCFSHGGYILTVLALNGSHFIS